MEAVQLLGVVGTVVGVIAAIATVALFARASYARARIEELRAVLLDERATMESLRVQKHELEEEHKSCQLAVVAAKKEVEVLQKLPKLAVQEVVDLIRQDRLQWWEPNLDRWHTQIIKAIREGRQ